jgi:hypothetical protein
MTTLNLDQHIGRAYTTSDFSEMSDFQLLDAICRIETLGSRMPAAMLPEFEAEADKRNLRGDLGDLQAELAAKEASAPKPRRMLCSCCGAETRGRQWHNRDTGFGLCVACIDYCGKRMSADEFQRCYGNRGEHFDIGGAL